MNTFETAELTRDCDVVQIPSGIPAKLMKGTPVDITQTLGGSYTLRAGGGLFRLGAENADAIGRTASVPAAAAASGPVEEQQVWDTLRTCYDPEIPVNIVDLGLVYDLGIRPLPSGNQQVFVKMTLTAPGCGMGPTIARDAQQKLLELPTVEEASVEIVWDPPWHQSMITEAGRKILGLG